MLGALIRRVLVLLAGRDLLGSNFLRGMVWLADQRVGGYGPDRPRLVPVRASPVPSVVRGSFVVKFFLSLLGTGLARTVALTRKEEWREFLENMGSRDMQSFSRSATRAAQTGLACTRSLQFISGRTPSQAGSFIQR